MIGAAIIPAIPPTGKTNGTIVELPTRYSTFVHKNVSHTTFTKKHLEGLSDEIYEGWVEPEGIIILIRCIRYLRDITYFYTDGNDEERMQLDGVGLNVPDVSTSEKILNLLTRWKPNGSDIKCSVIFLYKYREQINGLGYKFPDDIFDAGDVRL
jgi:hypothetical protein